MESVLSDKSDSPGDTDELMLGSISQFTGIRIGKHQGESSWKCGMQKMEKHKTYGAQVAFHVHEFYSTERVNSTARWMGAIPGMSFDMTTVDPDDGQPWDFNNQEKALKAGENQKNAGHYYSLGHQCAQHSANFNG